MDIGKTFSKFGQCQLVMKNSAGDSGSKPQAGQKRKNLLSEYWLSVRKNANCALCSWRN